MISRIQLIMKSRNISAAQFADEIGVQRSSVSHILTGRNNPSLDIILKILQRFPEVNSDWILTGNGAMLKSDIGKESSTLHAKSFISSTEKNNSDKNKELDLFAQSHNKADTIDLITENNVKPFIAMPEETKTNEGEEIKNPEGDKHLISFRTIDQIVIFYSDKTFSYYKPNN